MGWMDGMDGWDGINGWMDGMDGWMGWMDGCMGWMDGWLDMDIDIDNEIFNLWITKAHKHTWHLLGPADGHDKLTVSQVGDSGHELHLVIGQFSIVSSCIQLVKLRLQCQQRIEDLVVLGQCCNEGASKLIRVLLVQWIPAMPTELNTDTLRNNIN